MVESDTATVVHGVNEKWDVTSSSANNLTTMMSLQTIAQQCDCSVNVQLTYKRYDGDAISACIGQLYLLFSKEHAFFFHLWSEHVYAGEWFGKEKWKRDIYCALYWKKGIVILLAVAWSYRKSTYVFLGNIAVEEAILLRRTNTGPTPLRSVRCIIFSNCAGGWQGARARPN